MLTYKGPHYEYENVPIALRPLQQPHPPFWYGSSGAEGSTWAGEEGLHFVTLGANAFAKTNIDTFKAAFAKRGSKAAQPKPEFSGGVALGVQRHIFVDETDEKARAWAKPAMDNHLAQHQLDQEQARRHHDRGAHENSARRELRGMRRRGHGDRRLAEDRAGRDREACTRRSASTIC